LDLAGQSNINKVNSFIICVPPYHSFRFRSNIWVQGHENEFPVNSRVGLCCQKVTKSTREAIWIKNSYETISPAPIAVSIGGGAEWDAKGGAAAMNMNMNIENFVLVG